MFQILDKKSKCTAFPQQFVPSGHFQQHNRVGCSACRSALSSLLQRGTLGVFCMDPSYLSPPNHQIILPYAAVTAFGEGVSTSFAYLVGVQWYRYSYSDFSVQEIQYGKEVYQVSVRKYASMPTSVVKASRLGTCQLPHFTKQCVFMLTGYQTLLALVAAVSYQKCY